VGQRDLVWRSHPLAVDSRPWGSVDSSSGGAAGSVEAARNSAPDLTVDKCLSRGAEVRDAGGGDALGPLLCEVAEMVIDEAAAGAGGDLGVLFVAASESLRLLETEVADEAGLDSDVVEGILGAGPEGENPAMSARIWPGSSRWRQVVSRGETNPPSAKRLR
jgi:hypothetical protein